VLASLFATGFFMDEKLAGTTHGLGCAINDALSAITEALTNKSFKVFIKLWF
jgi:DNA gyrase/topoisomerase IV subunit B